MKINIKFILIWSWKVEKSFVTEFLYVNIRQVLYQINLVNVYLPENFENENIAILSILFMFKKFRKNYCNKLMFRSRL